MTNGGLTKSKENGFTVIELLVLLGTLTLILAGTVSFLLTSLSSSGKAEAVKEIRQNGDAVLKAIRSLLVSSNQVIGCYEEVPDDAPTELSFMNRGNLVTIKCVDDGGDSYISSNSARLTDQGVTVSECGIYCLQPAGGSAYANINFTLSVRGQEGLNDKEKVVQKFETSVSLIGI